MTKQRELILKIIRESAEHLTADEIFLQAKKSLPSLALGTVYRNLGILSADEQIVRLRVADQPDRYDKTLQKHDHLVCLGCGKVEDIFIPDLLPFLQQSAPNKNILSYRLKISYLCDDCKQ